jgi:hypothetical protein
VVEDGTREGEVVGSKAGNREVSKNREKIATVEASGWLTGGPSPRFKKCFAIFLIIWWLNS